MRIKMKKIVVALLALVLVFSLAACGKSEAVKNVEELIEKIKAVDLENASKIQAAKKAYDKLPEEDRAKVKKGNELDDMLKKLETLKIRR